MPIFLALDTSESFCSVALYANKKEFSVQQHSPREHTKIIWPLIETLLSQANISANEISHVICTNGPGSFTGVRVACSVAQGIATANNGFIIPVNTLECLAYTGLLKHSKDHIWAMMDARMQAVYSAIYIFEQNNIKITQVPAALNYHELLSIKPKSFFAIGSGWQLEQTKNLLSNNLINTNPIEPINLLKLGMSKASAAIDAIDFKLTYLRDIS